MLQRLTLIATLFLGLGLLAGCDDEPGLALGEACTQDSQCRKGLFCDPSTSTCQSTDLFRDRPDGIDTGGDNGPEDVGDEEVFVPECEEGEFQICGTGSNKCGSPIETCEDGRWSECSLREPEPEICDNIDNDCDGAVDEQVQIECGSNIGACFKGVRTCNAGVFSPCKGDRKPVEEACDGIDNDCNGEIDETCPCVDGQTQSCGTDIGVCNKGSQTCNAGVWSECNGGTDGTDEICDGLDNNCNGEVDDGVKRTFYFDRDGDGFGDPDQPTEACALPKEHAENNLDCDDNDPLRHPGRDEVCDGRDNDCNPATFDGSFEDWYEDPCDGPDSDLCEEGIYVCREGSQVCTDDTGDSLEICDGKDNDCNPATEDGSGESWLGANCDGPDSDACKEGIFSCQAGLQRCSDNTGDELELCDGIDNDCDPSTPDGSQEDWAGEACDGPDSDFCPEGVIACDANKERVCTDTTGDSLEICDGRDNDCDPSTPDGSFESWVGQSCDGPDVDLCREGLFQCTGGGQVCSDSTDSNLDLCDGTDNDCNPATEDGFHEIWFQQTCDGPDADTCEEGLFICQSSARVCTDNTGLEPDICDGFDNDCDPLTPDGSAEPWFGMACDGDDTDLCKEGAMRCRDGAQSCSDRTGDNLEICDGADNDCNPSTTDGSGESWLGEACDGTDTDFCAEGFYLCSNGAQACNDDPNENDEEICDNLDNNCNGQIDEGLQCNTPPVAVCPSDLDVDPLEVLTFDGSGSYDNENDTLTYRWLLIQRPADSTTSPDQPNDVSTTFFVDLAGEYEIQLNVSDGEYLDSCTFKITAVPPQDLHVQLVWQEGTGDVDLHLTAPNSTPLGAFFTRGASRGGPELDVWWAQLTTEWGPLGADGNGSLDIDNTVAYGPENINILQNPQVGGTYHIGVHHYCSQSIVDQSVVGISESHNVRVRVYCDGQRVATFPSETTWYTMTETGEFWIPASVTWTGTSGGCTVNPIGTQSYGVKYCAASGVCNFGEENLDCGSTQSGFCSTDFDCRPYEYCSTSTSRCLLNNPCTSSANCNSGRTCSSVYGMCVR